MLVAAPVRTGQKPRPEGLAVMELFVFLAFLIVLAAASMAGLTADSRDSADWAATVDGQRQPRRL
jgi:hypothetical protein